MRAVVVALLLLSSPARAELEVCKSEKAYAAQTPPVAEEVRALKDCLTKWEPILGQAREELAKGDPLQLPECAADLERWRSEAKKDPATYDNMVRRLAARSAVDKCVASALQTRRPAAVIERERIRVAAEKQKKSGREMAVLGGVFLGIGGVGLTTIGGVGASWSANESLQDDPLGLVLVGTMGGIAAAIAITGTIILSLGARKHQRAIRELALVHN